MSDTAVPARPRESLARQITRRVLLLSLSAIAGIVATIALSLLVTVQRVQSRLSEANIEAATTFDLFLRDIQSDLSSSSSSLSASTDTDALLLHMRVRNPSLLDVVLVDPAGKVLAQRSAASRPRRSRVERQPWLDRPPPPQAPSAVRALRPSEVYVGPVGFEGQVPGIDMAAIVTDEVGLSSGSLVVRVDLTDLWNATLGLRVGETGYVFITDDTGQLIAYRNRGLIEEGSRLVNLVGRTPQAIAASRWNVYRGLGGRLVIASARPLKVVPWFAVVELPLSEALLPFFRLMAVLVLVLSVVVGLLYGLNRFTRRRIVVPLEALSEAVGRMSAGRWDQRIEASSRDELGQLADSFNALAGQLQSSFETLEKQVRELRRTEAELTRLYAAEHAAREDADRLRAATQALSEKYRSIFENAVEGIFQSTPEGRFITANPAVARMLGFASPDDLIAHTADIGTQLYVDPAHRLKFKRILEEQGRVQGFITQARRKDGATIWMSVSARTVTDAAGSVLYYEGTTEDITERKRSEEAEAALWAALKRAAVEWERTFDSMDMPIMILGAGRVIRLNRAARELAGSPDYDEAVDQPIVGLGPGQPWQKASEAAARVAHTRGHIHEQVRDEASGKTWDVAAGPSPGPTGGESRVIVVAKDLTETVRLQESLRRNETMSAMGMLVAGVAHEVRNPLFAITANLDAFEASIGPGSEFEPCVTVLRGEVDRLAALMQELLDFGKPMESTPMPAPIDAVVAEAADRCARLAHRSQVKLMRSVAPGLPHVSMDGKRMVQVLQNLLANAIQHSPAGGVVTVSASQDGSGGDASIVLEVKDSGPGVAQEDLPRIFTPFFSRRRGGTGLGLAIVQRIVDEHGGTVFAANRPEGGARIVVRLPCASSAPRVSALPS